MFFVTSLLIFFGFWFFYLVGEVCINVVLIYSTVSFLFSPPSLLFFLWSWTHLYVGLVCFQFMVLYFGLLSLDWFANSRRSSTIESRSCESSCWRNWSMWLRSSFACIFLLTFFNCGSNMIIYVGMKEFDMGKRGYQTCICHWLIGWAPCNEYIDWVGSYGCQEHNMRSIAWASFGIKDEGKEGRRSFASPSYRSTCHERSQGMSVTWYALKNTELFFVFVYPPLMFHSYFLENIPYCL